MKRNRKSAIIRTFILVAGTAVISACDSTKNVNLPHVFGPNEIPASVIDEPRGINPELVPADATYPRLGDVPAKPKDFTSQPVIDQTKQQMESDREEAGRLREQESTSTPRMR